MITQSDLERICDTPQQIEADRQEIIEDANNNFDDLDERFKLSMLGICEASDRAWIQHEIWYEYVAKHPTVVLHPEIFATAHMVHSLMEEVYQKIQKLHDQATT